LSRSGVNFEIVSAAAQRLSARGYAVTVDSVRTELGTGSKSTIAPLVKRWKNEQLEGVEQLLSTLPGGLVLAVKQLHDSMRQQFSDELALAREVAESRVIELEALNTTQAQELAVLRDESTTFQKELKGCKDEIQKVTSQYDAEMTRTRELRIRYESLEQLAAAGSAENRNLNRPGFRGGRLV
jgi:hypothetical protein